MLVRVCVCMCVCDRKRERERKSEKERGKQRKDRERVLAREIIYIFHILSFECLFTIVVILYVKYIK